MLGRGIILFVVALSTTSVGWLLFAGMRIVPSGFRRIASDG